MRRLLPLLLLPLFLPQAAGAATVCCSCAPKSETETSCLTVDESKLTNRNCAQLPSIIGKSLSGWTCKPSPLSQGNCHSVPENGICVKGPLDAYAAGTDSEAVTPSGGPSAKPEEGAIIPNLNTPIPGFSFTGSAVTKDTSSLLAQYVAGLYGFAISIVAIAATIMFTYGAFQYLLGSAITTIQNGKNIMQEAVIGMILVLSAHLILRTVNPDTLTLDTLYIEGVRPERAIFGIPENVYQGAIGSAPISRVAMIQLTQQKAKETGISELPCIVYASMIHESGGRIDVVGHDENFQSSNYTVRSRQTFLQSGKRYSGLAFPPVSCTDPSCQRDQQLNDDVRTFDPSKPPEYGLDWRFSHGFGASQSTIFPNSRPCTGKEEYGRGFRIAGTCFTIPQLLTPEGNAAAMVAHFRAVFLAANGDVTKAFISYAGNVKADNPAIVSRMRVYERCRARNP